MSTFHGATAPDAGSHFFLRQERHLSHRPTTKWANAPDVANLIPLTRDEAQSAATVDAVVVCFFKRLPVRRFGQRIIGARRQEHREIVVIAEFLPEVAQVV